MLTNIGLFEIIIILCFFLLPFILCIIALVDILRSNFTGYNKIIWVLVVIMLPLIGSVLYFVIGVKQKEQLVDINRMQ